MRAQPVDDDYADRMPARSSKHDSMKILPIVVIPPMAPMPPIQLSGHSGSGATKMSLSPQFNNYFVAEKRKSPHRARSLMSQLQDQQNYADYNEANSDRSYRTHRRAGRYSARMSPYLSERDYGSSGRIRDAPRDDDDLGPPRQSRMARHHGGRYGLRRATGGRGQLLRGQQELARIKSIRDILEQQIQFDDDPLGADFGGQMDGVGGSSRDDYDDSPAIYQNQQRGDLWSGASNGNNRAHQLDLANEDTSRDKLIKDDKQPQTGDLSPYYYTREILEDSPRVRYEPEVTRSREERLPVSSERDPLDEDEWKFDSIKSMAHLAPNKTDVSLNTTILEPQSPATTITSTTSTKPPKTVKFAKLL